MKRWKIHHIAATIFSAERDGEEHLLDAHCLACAKLSAYEMYGGDVDLRGWHTQGECGLKLRDEIRTMRIQGSDKGE